MSLFFERFPAATAAYFHPLPTARLAVYAPPSEIAHETLHRCYHSSCVSPRGSQLGPAHAPSLVANASLREHVRP